MAATKDGSTIDMPSTKQNRVIKEINDSGDEVDKVDVIDINSTKASKSVLFKDLVQSSETKAGFLTFEAWLAFTQLRLAFIQVLILYYFD